MSLAKRQKLIYSINFKRFGVHILRPNKNKDVKKGDWERETESKR